jgi:hypothetical protein
VTSPVSVVLLHYFPERVGNTRRAVLDLFHGTVQPTEVLVWNNDLPVRWDFPVGLQVHVLQSPRNLGCRARFIAAAAACSPWVLFHDNDIAVGPRTLENLLAWARELPESILTLDAYTVSLGQPYASRRAVRRVTDVQRVDVALGRLELVHRNTLARIIHHVPIYSESLRMDDLWLSAAAWKEDVPIYVPPATGEAAFVELSTCNVGSSVGPSKASHFAERERLFKELFP